MSHPKKLRKFGGNFLNDVFFNSGVGKSSLIKRYVYGKFSGSSRPTVRSIPDRVFTHFIAIIITFITFIILFIVTLFIFGLIKKYLWKYRRII